MNKHIYEDMLIRLQFQINVAKNNFLQRAENFCSNNKSKFEAIANDFNNKDDKLKNKEIDIVTQFINEFASGKDFVSELPVILNSVNNKTQLEKETIEKMFKKKDFLIVKKPKQEQIEKLLTGKDFKRFCEVLNVSNNYQYVQDMQDYINDVYIKFDQILLTFCNELYDSDCTIASVIKNIKKQDSIYLNFKGTIDFIAKIHNKRNIIVHNNGLTNKRSGKHNTNAADTEEKIEIEMLPNLVEIPNKIVTFAVLVVKMYLDQNDNKYKFNLKYFQKNLGKNPLELLIN